MKVLLVTPVPPPINGCSLANSVLINRLSSVDDISIQIIDTNTQNVSSGKVGAFDISKVTSFLGSYKGLWRIVGCDIVYYTPGQTFFGIAKYIPFYLLAILFKKPYLIHLHGNHLGNEYKLLTGIKKRIFKFFISRAAGGVVLSRSLRSNFDGLLPDDRIYEVPNFAQDSLIYQTAELQKPIDKLRILYLSNLMKEKGIEDFLDCLELLKDQSIDFEADIAGKIEDESLESLSARLKSLEEYVKYHGVVQGEKKTKLLNESNVFVMPTYYRMEGQPIAIIEAMATGNIVVTTNYSGIPDIVSTANGFFVEPRNPQSIAETLTKISGDLASGIAKISRTNMNYVKEHFTESIFSNNVLQILYAVSKSK